VQLVGAFKCSTFIVPIDDLLTVIILTTCVKCVEKRGHYVVQYGSVVYSGLVLLRVSFCLFCERCACLVLAVFATRSWILHWRVLGVGRMTYELIPFDQGLHLLVAALGSMPSVA
jgi:hypothetical protein